MTSIAGSRAWRAAVGRWRLALAGLLVWIGLGAGAASAEVMIGAYLQGDGWSRSRIASEGGQLAKPLSFVNVFSGFSHSWRQLWHQASNIAAEGAVPMISWMPIDSSRRADNILPEIAAGEWDAYLDQWMADLQRWLDTRPPNRQLILLRFAHEFNGNWYAYGDDPDALIAAWRYLHDRFAAAGLNAHVEWVWSANYVDVDSHNDMTRYYPGFDYVNWTSLDGYNWGSNYSWTRWKSFSEIFAASYRLLVDHYPSKPVLIAEVASTEPADLPRPEAGQFGSDEDAGEDKSLWMADLLETLEQSFPAVRAITLFNFNKELSWSITDSQSTGLQATNDKLLSDYYSAEYLTTLVAAPPLECSVASEFMAGAGLQSDDSGRRLIDRVQQRKRARLIRPPAADLSLERDGFATMTAASRQRLAEQKLEALLRPAPIQVHGQVRYEAYLEGAANSAGLATQAPHETGTAPDFAVPAHLLYEYEMRFDGEVQVNRAGNYTLELTPANATFLDIDGVSVVDWIESSGKKTVSLFLSAGTHELVLQVQDTVNELPLSLVWTLEN